jgi:hypothetical protein
MLQADALKASAGRMKPKPGDVDVTNKAGESQEPTYRTFTEDSAQ